MSYTPFTAEVIKFIRAIPEGRVATYGGIAALAGSPRAARQVVRILHTCSKKEKLPWQRVVNREGRIALKPFQGYEEQQILLEMEGITFNVSGQIDLNEFLWQPDEQDISKALAKATSE